MARPSLLFSLGLGLLLGMAGNACTNDPEVNPDACGMITDACHAKDDGSDPVINGCHSSAHDGNDEACTNDLQMCLDVCNAAPDVGTGDHDSGDHDSGDHGTGDHGSGDHGSGDHGTTGADGSTSHGTDSHGTDSHGSTSHGSSTGADDSSQANCDELASTCHDVADAVGMMCHDIGHDGDEAACAKAWVECIEHCTA
ncbi:hypothetical protein [Paraliomyxa miuraensis]|uniref:hypothetical protein n=1 Tax=Paraliomyxa miuraensis TaxID=376150 RepID=UPI002257ECCC|nr:hypothetical protein [Paraliomyxa miuraensis]MCX4240679.1 hypothetical protein [Paraliomyxa miuraensis]